MQPTRLLAEQVLHEIYEKTVSGEIVWRRRSDTEVCADIGSVFVTCRENPSGSRFQRRRCYFVTLTPDGEQGERGCITYGTDAEKFGPAIPELVAGICTMAIFDCHAEWWILEETKRGLDDLIGPQKENEA